MQTLTKTLETAIRGSYQVPLCRLEIYNQDESLAGEILDVLNVTIDVASSRKVLRTFTANLNNKDGKYTPFPSLFSDNLLWYNKTIKIFYGFMTSNNMDQEEWLPQGVFTLDSIKPDITPDGLTLEISGQDLVSKMVNDQFDDVYKIKETTASESSNWAIAAGSSITASSSVTGHEAAKAADSDYVTYWTPALTDVNPTITLDMGATRALNVIYLYWGKGGADYNNRIFYYLESSLDGSSWTVIQDLNDKTVETSLFGDVEHVFNEINCRYIRISIKAWDGLLELRYIKAQKIIAVQTVDKVIRDVALTAGITKIKLPVTRRWIKEKQAEIGDEKHALCAQAATSIGWVEPFMDEDGYYTTKRKDINPKDPVWEFDVMTDNIFGYSPRYTNDIYNVIVAVYKSSTEKAIVGKAIDDDPDSPTSIQQLGRRVYKYENDLIDTQDKADQFVQQKLFERTRFKHETSLPITGHPGLQPGDVVKVTVPDAHVEDMLYYVTGYKTTYDHESSQFDSDLNISQM